MKNFLLITGLALLCVARPLFGQEPALTDADIKKLLQVCVEKQKRAPGIVVGVVDAGGSKIFSHGRFDADSTNTVNGDTVFEIGSITKAFTGQLLALAATRGELDLDAPAGKFLPVSVKLPSRKDRQISLRHLATQTSGLQRMPDNFKSADPDNPYADYTVEELYAFLRGCKLNSTPGEKYDYSNLGMGLLGHILGRKAGTNYEALVRKEICDPLQMTDTRMTLTPEMKKRLAPGHNSPGVRVKNWDIPTLAGAGALRSTANDMLKLLAANMGLRPSPLLPAMEQAHVTQHEAGLPNTEIGLGWHIRQGFGSRYVWHNGATGGYHAFAGFDKKQRRGVVVLGNSANTIDDLGWHLLNPKFKVEGFSTRQAAKIDYKVYDDYAGRYKFSFGGLFVITRDGNRLLAKLDNQPTLEIFPESEAFFFVTVVDAQISFVKDAQGNVTHLILHQNGLDQKATKARPEN